MKRITLTVVLVLALVVNALVAVRLLAPDAAAELNADDAGALLDQLDALNADGPTAAEPVTLDGRWTLRADAPSTVGYRISEQAVGHDVSTAVGRTTSVQAELQVEGDVLVAADVHADLRTLASDQILRDRVIHTQGLVTDTYPEARFRATAPVALSGVATTDAIVRVAVPGEVTLRGTTLPVTASVAIELRRSTVLVTGSFDVVLSDFGIEKPKVANILTIADTGTVEWQLFLVHAGGGPSVAADAAAPSDDAATGPSATVALGDTALGPVLVDGDGRTLYLLGGDPIGVSTCLDEHCLEDWPVLESAGAPVAGPGVEASALGTIDRPDGLRQVTYHGLPLYLCAYDDVPGDVNGQGADDVWYVVSAAGEPVL